MQSAFAESDVSPNNSGMFFRVTSLFLVILFGGVSGYNPVLTLDTCTRQSVTLTLTGAENGGIIYVQGAGAGCKQTTAARSTSHTFELGQCNIKWGETFRLVVQRRAQYQTGGDRQIPVTCLADLADLGVSNKIGTEEREDEAEQMLFIKPSASMRLLKSGRSVGGASVTLGDVITMELKLHTDYEGDFDISAKSCTASNIPIISEYCAVDKSLFPQFTKVSRGHLSSAFGAFRTTDLMGGAVTMIFTCTLEVCLGNCDVVRCPDDHSGWGQRKRDLRSNGTHSPASRPSPKPSPKTSPKPSLKPFNNTKPRPIHNATSGPEHNTSRVAPGSSRDPAVMNSTHNEYNVYSARKRDVLNREHNDTVYLVQIQTNVSNLEELHVQGTLAIAPDENNPTVAEEKAEMCMNYAVSVTLIVFMAVGFLVLGITTWVLTRRISQKGRAIEKRRRRSSRYRTCQDEDDIF